MKYGVLQKIAYLATPFLILAAAYTGFMLWCPRSNWAFFHAGATWIASLFNAGGGADLMPVRIVHYYIMWVILIFTAFHVYLANIYNFAPSKMIFAWKKKTRAITPRLLLLGSSRRALGNQGPFHFRHRNDVLLGVKGHGRYSDVSFPEGGTVVLETHHFHGSRRVEPILSGN